MITSAHLSGENQSNLASLEPSLAIPEFEQIIPLSEIENSGAPYLSVNGSTQMVANPALDQGPLLNEVDAARFLAVSVRTLQAWRTKGAGPPFVRLGRAVRYSRQALIDWVHANTHATS